MKKIINKHQKKLLAILILILTAGGFLFYFLNHKNALEPLKNLSLFNISAILILYGAILLALTYVLKCSLELFEKKIVFHENLQLNIWSNIVNFFGPLQSGPGVRAIYLKKKHSLDIKKFIYVSLIYYCFIALISCLFIAVGGFNFMLALITIILASIVIYAGFKLLSSKINKADKARLSLETISKLFIITLIQLFITSLIYLIELHIVNKSIDYHQVLAYTGVANLSLFVAITPGAIGFRESFLLLTQKLHHINASNILSASIIDRSVYLLFLLILIAVAASMHLKKRLS